MAAEIFISYSSRHRDLTRALVAALEAQYGEGSVWWDHALESWGDYETQIRNALNSARVVVVIWTKAAGESAWVKSEAARADRAGKLVNVCPPDTSWEDVPSPYDQHHVNRFDDTPGILRSIAAVWRGTPVRTAIPEHELYELQHKRRLIDPKRRALAPDRRDISPIDLLQAKYEVVPYVDVTGLKADMLAWCRDGSRATVGRLVHGPGGLGKTRLLIDVAVALRQDGWLAGFLDRPHEQVAATLQQRWRALDQLIADGEDSGLLVVIDYAEARQDEVTALAERLVRRPESDSRKIRLVLLARGAGPWWTNLHDEIPEIARLFRRGRGGVDAIDLPTFAGSKDRLSLFAESAKAYGPILAAQGFAPRAADPPPDHMQRIATEPGYARPLAVQMEALLWLTSDASATGGGVDVLLRRILGLERAHWKKLIGDVDQHRLRDIARGAAQATAVQGTPTTRSTERLLMADGFYGNERSARVQVDPVIRNLSHLYGKPDGGLAHLEPDLIGEHHVASIGDSDLLDGCMRWIDGEPADTRQKRRRDLLTVLQRATLPEHGAAAERAAGLLDHLIERHVMSLAADMVAVMLETPGQLIQRLSRKIDTLDEPSLRAIDEALPDESVTLMELAAFVAVHRADLGYAELQAAQAGPDTSSEKTEQALIHLGACKGAAGVRLAALRRDPQALVLMEQAISIYRLLLQSPGQTFFFPHLALSLANAAPLLARLRRYEDSRGATEDALDIFRRLAEALPDTFLPDVASTLYNLANTLTQLDQREAAHAAAQEAVDIYRRLAEARPNAFLPRLAMGLNGLAKALSQLHQAEPALAATQKAIAILQSLVQTQADAYVPDLALSLCGLSVDLTNLGRHEEARVAAEEAIHAYRELASYSPDAFLEGLALSQNNLGRALSNLGRHAEAIAAVQEGVKIFRWLAERHMDAFLPKLAGGLEALGVVLMTAGRHNDAAGAIREGLVLTMPLVAHNPQPIEPLVRELFGEYLAACLTARVEPYRTLAESVQVALGADARLDDPFIARWGAKIDGMLALAYKTGALDETQLAELPVDLADRLRAHWNQVTREAEV